MTNVGILPGLNADGWRTYPLEVKCVGNTVDGGSPVDPIIRTANGGASIGTSTNFARYLIVDHQYVVVEVMMTFFHQETSEDWGAGGAYAIKLPFPAYRMTGPGNPCPIPLSNGAAMAYWAFANPWVTVPLIPTLADPFDDLRGHEDEYFQCYTPFWLRYSNALGNSLSASTVTTSLSDLWGAPRAEDIEFTFIDAAGVGSGSGLVGVTATTGPPSTPSFTLQCGGAAANADFFYRILGKHPSGQFSALLSPTVPWPMQPASDFGLFPNIFIQLAYEAKR